MNALRRFAGLAVTLIAISSIVFVWFARQDIYDWWRLREYNPPHEVSALADSTTMTSEGRKIFYVNQPHISAASEFNAECSRETSIVLGCYVPGKGIFLFDVDDPRLTGVKEVTAAHEMLHAAYDRLSSKEQREVDAMTRAAFLQVTNERIKANVEKYREVDPAVVPNELHSILATEVAELPAELEHYYKRYFSNRKAIVAFSNRYESEFDSRQQQVANYDAKLANLKLEIDANKNELTIQYNALTSEKHRLDGLLNSGQVAAYNQSVPAFNAQVNRYNAAVKNADGLINNYNALVEMRNSVAGEVQDLAQAIDSRPQSF